MRSATNIAKKIQFLGEQNGEPESDFKRCVIPLLAADHAVERCYLARVSYDLSSPVVALCIRSRQVDESLLRKIGAVFASMFGSDQHLDMFFIDRDQEGELSRVCSSFFDRAKGTASADFYLASSDGYGLEDPRQCKAIKRLRGEVRDDYLLVRITPPLAGQVFGLGARDLDEVILATRHEGESLFPIERWPVFVHVARLLVPYVGQDFVRTNEMESIAWAELYATEDAARAKVM